MRRWIIVAMVMTALALSFSPAHAVNFLRKPLDKWRDDLKKTDRPDLRRSAAFALGQIGPTAVIAIDELIDRVKNDKDAGVREMSARAIGDILIGIRPLRKPESEWTKAGAALEAALANDADGRVRRSAAYALGAFGDMASKSLPALRKALGDRVPTVRQNAAWAIGKIGDTSDDTMRELCARLGDESPLVRRLTASALSDIQAKATKKSREPALALLKMLKEERDEVVARTALGALAGMTDESLQKYARDIYPLLESKDSETARAAAFVLGNMGGEPALKALPKLQKALADPNAAIQLVAAACLANAGSVAAPAVSDLAEAMKKSKNFEVSSVCAVALGQISKSLNHNGDARARKVAEISVPALVAGLKTKVEFSDDATTALAKEQLRQDCTEALSCVRYPNNKDALPVITEIIRKDNNPRVRHGAIWTLHGCNDLDRFDELKKVLLAVLDETSMDSTDVRYETARLLAFHLKDRAPDKVVTILLEMLANRRLNVLEGSKAAIKNIGTESTRGNASVTTLQGGDARYMAADALGFMVKKIKNNDAVIKALTTASKDPDRELSKSAAKVLQDIKRE